MSSQRKFTFAISSPDEFLVSSSDKSKSPLHVTVNKYSNSSVGLYVLTMIKYRVAAPFHVENSTQDDDNADDNWQYKHDQQRSGWKTHTQCPLFFKLYFSLVWPSKKYPFGEKTQLVKFHKHILIFRGSSIMPKFITSSARNISRHQHSSRLIGYQQSSCLLITFTYLLTVCLFNPRTWSRSAMIVYFCRQNDFFVLKCNLSV